MITFEAGYDRTGVIWIEICKCSVCKNMKKCLCIDSSAEEYGPGNICKDCINEMDWDKSKNPVHTP